MPALLGAKERGFTAPVMEKDVVYYELEVGIRILRIRERILMSVMDINFIEGGD